MTAERHTDRELTMYFRTIEPMLEFLAALIIGFIIVIGATVVITYFLPH